MNLREAFHILAGYFQGGLRWMVQDGRQTELGVAGDVMPVRASADAEPIMAEMRLVKVERDGPARLVSAPDLTIMPGEEANFSLAGADGASLGRVQYVCSAEVKAKGGGVISVAVELKQAGVSAPVKLSGAVRSGEESPVPAAYSRIGDARYVLYVWARRSGAGPARKAGT